MEAQLARQAEAAAAAAEANVSVIDRLQDMLAVERAERAAAEAQLQVCRYDTEQYCYPIYLLHKLDCSVS